MQAGALHAPSEAGYPLEKLNALVPFEVLNKPLVKRLSAYAAV